MMELCDAAGAKGVTAVHQNPGDPLSDVVFLTTELTDVQAPGRIVQLDDIHFFLGF